MEKTIAVGVFTLDLAFAPEASEHFMGIGAVACGGTVLRSGALPWIFHTESEDGFRFAPSALDEVRRDGEAVVLRGRAKGDWLPRIQEADAMGDARIRTRRVAAPEATFEWTFRPLRESVAGVSCDVLGWRIKVCVPGHPIHWILEDTTWEIGGAAEGGVLIQQDVSTMDLEQEIRKDSAFSTIEKFFTEGWGGAYPMDMLPRAAGSAFFDYQAKGDAALCLLSEKPGLTRARIEKFADENVVHYTDRVFLPLAESLETPERKLLVRRFPAALARHEWRNWWLDCFVAFRERLLAPYGFEAEVPLPCVHAHLWDEDLHRYGVDWTREIRAALPEYARLGFKEIFTHGVWDSITSDPHPPESGNICCPYQFKYAEKFGGVAGMKELTRAAQASGLTLYQWFSFHLSRYAPIWKEHPDWVMREANGDPWDGNYGALWSGRFAGPFGAWMRGQVKDTCREAGLGGIFWDSYQNLGVTCVDWQGPEKAPQAEEVWKFQADLQKSGLRQRCEIVTPFGVGQVAMFGFQDDAFRRRLWSDTVKQDAYFAMLDLSPGFFSNRYVFGPDRITPDLYFRLLAHRVVPGMGARPWRQDAVNAEHAQPTLPGGEWAERYAAINRLYTEALPRMKRLRLTEGGRYTLWLDDADRPSVLWAFESATADYRGTARALAGGREVVCEGTLKLEAGEVWLLD